MLDRVDHAILDVARVVGLIADQMLPEPALPDAAFAAPGTDGAQALLPRQRFGEMRLDQPSAGGKVGVAGRQRPDGMEMVRKHHHGIDLEW